MSLAIFDLDNTLLAGDSDHAWGSFMVEKSLVDGPSYATANDQFYADYQAGTLDIRAYQEFALQPLTRYAPAELAQLHREFMATRIAPMRQAKADQLVDEHRQRGDILMIITATNSFVTRPIATALGIEHLLATDGELDANGYYTRKIAGTPCFQQGKVERLNSWLREHRQSLDGSYFYSDSHNDLPLLRAVNFPVAVDPDPRLAATAEALGWPIISLRQ